MDTISWIESPTAQLRFVVRCRKKVLQQKWILETECYTSLEWRDVPVETESHMERPEQ